MLEDHPSRYPAAVAAQRVTGVKLRLRTAAAFIEQGRELDPGWLQQA